MGEDEEIAKEKLHPIMGTHRSPERSKKDYPPRVPGRGMGTWCLDFETAHPSRSIATGSWRECLDG